MSKHTPGPWAWDEGGCLRSKVDDAPAIVQTDGGYYGPYDADRDLIAAAPELFAMVRTLAGYFRHLEGGRVMGRPSTAEMEALLARAGG